MVEIDLSVNNRQTMSHLFIQGVEQYGYLAIFLFVFLQEVGFPSPIPNEYVLLFSGYMSSVGMLNIFFVIGVIVAADLMAGLMLFEIFYRAGSLIDAKRPSWLNRIFERLMVLKNRLQHSGNRGTIIGRLSPFIRGWVVVICGLLHMPRSVFSKVLIGTTCVWTFAYVGVGFFIGPRVQLLYAQNKLLGMFFILLPLFVLLVYHLVCASFTKKGNKYLVNQNGV